MAPDRLLVNPNSSRILDNLGPAFPNRVRAKPEDFPNGQEEKSGRNSWTWTNLSLSQSVQPTNTNLWHAAEIHAAQQRRYTMNVYGNASLKARQQANSKVVQMVMPKKKPLAIAF